MLERRRPARQVGLPIAHRYKRMHDDHVLDGVQREVLAQTAAIRFARLERDHTTVCACCASHHQGHVADVSACIDAGRSGLDDRLDGADDGRWCRAGDVLPLSRLDDLNRTPAIGSDNVQTYVGSRRGSMRRTAAPTNGTRMIACRSPTGRRMWTRWTRALDRARELQEASSHRTPLDMVRRPPD